MSNYALVQLKLSQIALTLADNASRVGVQSSLSLQQLREVDVNDVFQGARLQGGGLAVTTNGRITLSSLEVNDDNGQWIHWQRCVGIPGGSGNDSSYGVQGTGASGTGFAGMGDPGAKVTAPADSAVMFVEINYTYQPLVSSYFVGTTRLRSIASMIVRDNRSLEDGLTDPAPGAPHMTCDKHTA